MLSGLHSTGNYLEELYGRIREYEAYVPGVYSDPIGIPSIGLGYNLQTWGDLILETFGFDLSGEQLTGDALASEKSYIAALKNIFNKKYTPGPVGTNELYRRRIYSKV